MNKFLVGNKYNTRSACDHDCVWEYTVVKRTVSTITLEDAKGKTTTCRINKQISEYRNSETVLPLGRYSMCPVLSADHEA